MVGGGDPCTWNFRPNWPCWSENADFQSIFARSVSSITPSEKSLIITNRKSTTRFPMSLWTSNVAPNPPKGAESGLFRLKLHFTWGKSATKFHYVNSVSDKVLRHSLAYLSVQKWFAGDVAYYVKFGRNWHTAFKNADFQSIFATSASAVTLSEKKNFETVQDKMSVSINH